MKNLILFLFIFCLSSSATFGATLDKFEILGNDRISNDTIKIFTGKKIGDDLKDIDLNKILKNLYNTNFFSDVSINFSNNTLKITVKENQIIQSIKFDGIKKKSLIESLEEQLDIKKNSPYVEFLVKKNRDKILNSLRSSGYFFSSIDLYTQVNTDNTVSITFDINLGEKALVNKISFTGDKIFKDGKLLNIIVTEESRFWKFLSQKKFLNQKLIELDKNLLENYYLNNGYYNVEILNTTAKNLINNKFDIEYNINAGKKIYFDKFKLNLPNNFDKENFSKVIEKFDTYSGTYYSKNKVKELIEEINMIGLNKQYQFINANIQETLVGNDKINITLDVDESDKFFVNRINISGNDITNEIAIRNLLVVDEGDPFNEILHKKSINNIKGSGLFSDVVFTVNDLDDVYKKDINIDVTEKPTGEISAGAGYGTSGQVITFGIKENNFRGNASKLDTQLSISTNSLRGSLTYFVPNYKNTDNSLNYSISRTNTDNLFSSGYKNELSDISVGTSFQYKRDLYVNPSFALNYEKLVTSTNASKTIKEQEGDYYNLNLIYGLTYDKRNQSFQPSDGYISRFSQRLPLLSNNYTLFNRYDFKYYQPLSEDYIGSFSFYSSTINSLENNGKVKISDRLNVPQRKLRGFKKGELGPTEKNEFIGGNYVSAVTLATTAPSLFQNFQTIDFSIFVDAANVWGVDYNSSLDNSTIRSSTGLAVDWMTPIGPLNFVIAQPLTKASSDKEEFFRFDIGTTF